MAEQRQNETDLAPSVATEAETRCSCCGRTYTPVQFSALFYVGRQEDGLGSYLKLRNCSCGSTISVQL
jgi:hypothetical protein